MKQCSRAWPRQTASGFCRAVGCCRGFSPLDRSWLTPATASGPWAQPPFCPHLLQSFSEPGGSETPGENRTHVPFVSDRGGLRKHPNEERGRALTCRHAPLAASTTWLVAKCLNSRRAKPVRQIISCRSRAEGPGVGGLDLPLHRNARRSGIWTKRAWKAPRFPALCFKKWGQEEGDQIVSQHLCYRYRQGPARGA